MGSGSSKCQKELELEKMAIELFLKYTKSNYTKISSFSQFTSDSDSDDDTEYDLNNDYTEFKKKRPTMRRLELYETLYAPETEGGTQKRRQRRKRTRRNGLFKS